MTTAEAPQPKGSVSEIRQRAPIWRQWNLIANFAKRDLKAKFNGTFLGWAWSLVVPLASLGIYTLVFSVFFKMPPPDFGNGRAGIFVLWLFGGLSLWTFFSSSVNAGIAGLVSTGGLLQKIYFPSYTPVIGAGLAVGVQSLIELGIYLAALVVLLNIGWTWLLIPVLLGLYTVFSWSISTVLAVLNIYARDLAHLTNVVLQLVFYVTPILYTIDFVPESHWGLPARDILAGAPLAQFITMFRNITYDLTPGTWAGWGVLVLWTGAALGLAVLVYRAKGGDIGERI